MFKINNKASTSQFFVSDAPIRNDIGAVIRLGKFVRDVANNAQVSGAIRNEAALLIRSLQAQPAAIRAAEQNGTASAP